MPGLRPDLGKGDGDITPLTTCVLASRTAVDSLRWDIGVGETARFVVAIIGSLIIALGIWFVHKKLFGTPDRRRPRSNGPLGVMTTSQQLELNLEAELFGTGALRGFCAHGVLAHRDARHLVFRLVSFDDEVPWGAGDEIEVYFWRENDAGYLFKSKVIDVRGVGAYVVMHHPESMERKQRRLHVRVAISDSVRFLHIPAGEVPRRMGIPGEGSGGLCEGLCEDLSAGGFRLRCSATLAERDYVSIAAFEPLGGDEILARVVTDLGCDENGAHSYGLQYAGLPASARERIMREVFKLQRRSISVPAVAGEKSSSLISFTDLGEVGGRDPG